jgi:deoxyribodipyrimidine photo-lyase
MGGRLVYRRGPWVDTVLATAAEAGSSEIRVARDVSAIAQARIRELREATDIPVVLLDSITAISPTAAAPSGSDYAQVFTPYFRRWSEAPRRSPATTATRFTDHDLVGDPLPGVLLGGTSPDRQVGGEAAGRARLDEWLPRSPAYDESRNALPEEGTSRLSADLHFGTISALEVVTRAERIGAEAFVRQVAWRDFNHQLLFHRPEVATRNFRGSELRWADDAEGLLAWRTGTTGFPVVDAAMRQLLHTGWMHNRARMITASFLTKDLMIDWRQGARWFMTWLTDGDVANNQLGWQWVAGTGTDANPTRIFNPTIQSERFDPDGAYIRRWIPELGEVDAPDVHDPPPLTRAATGYPLPIVDHHEAIRDFKAARGYR